MENHVKVSGLLKGEVDTSALFEKHTVDEIREIEKKTRQNIERKKEELRQMVGERYRDLIQAADTITDMKNSAYQVTETVSKMQDLCQNMQKSFSPHSFARKPVDKRKDDQNLYSIAAQIKLLLDTPEKIWSALESEQYLHATCVFLLARHINTSLSIDAKQNSVIVQFFPVLTRQWTAVSHFKLTILQTCKEKLKACDLNDDVVAQCLCSILLLEDTTPRQVFNEFLLSRTAAIQEQLHSVDSQVKSQICQATKILTMTVHQIHALFYAGDNSSDIENCNLLLSTLATVTEKREGNSVVSAMNYTSISRKYLPESVYQFRPVPRHHASAIERTTLQKNSQQWIEACLKTIDAGVAKLLGFIDTVKALAAIRDEIWDMLQQDKSMSSWETICEKTLNRKLTVWEQFLSGLFCDRTKAILQVQFESAVDNSKQQIASVLDDIANTQDRLMNFERDLSCYVWSEAPSDLPANTAWVPLNTRTLLDSGALVMKARAYTPAVQSLCRSVDSKLKLLLEDMTYYTGSEEVVTSQEAGPFDRFADRLALQQFVQNTCAEHVARLISHLQKHLYASKQQLTNSDDVIGNKTVIDRMLLLARFTSALCELSPCLQKCVVFTREVKSDLVKKPTPYRSQSKPPDDPVWTKMKLDLTSFSKEANEVWIDYTCKLLLGQLQSNLLNTRSETILHSLTKWDCIEIEEETEEGRTVRSKIRVPMQASWYLQNLLYSVCEEINRIGGHALQRSTLTKLTDRLSDEILQCHQSLLDSKNESETNHSLLTQNRALQLWFDIRFLSFIFPRKDESQAAKAYSKMMTSLLENLESRIDPFDFDVFTPYMNSNLLKHTQRCQVLYGALVSLDKHAHTSTYRTPPSGQQEQHNVLALTATASRFTLLPLSSQSRNTSAIVDAPTPKTMSRSFAATTSSASSLPPMNEEQSKSFLGQMSSMWFNNATK